MKRSIKIQIAESQVELRLKVKQETDGRLKERLQFLYWLKTEKVKTLQEAAQFLGRHRNTISEWILAYETRGLAGLLERQSPPGRTPAIPEEVLDKLKEKLACEEGFNSYWEIQKWLSEEFQCHLPYHTVFRICHDKLKASPKVPRPRNPKQDPEKLEVFKKNSLTKSSR